MNLRQLVIEVLIEQLEEIRKEHDKQMDRDQIEKEYIKYRQLAEKYGDCLRSIVKNNPMPIADDADAATCHGVIDVYRRTAARTLGVDYESSLEVYKESIKPNTTFDEHDGC